eukprot:7883-Heterococcus_DN1.PRE.1
MYYRRRAHAVIGLDFLNISKTAFRQIIPMAPMPHCATISMAASTVTGKALIAASLQLKQGQAAAAVLTL